MKITVQDNLSQVFWPDAFKNKNIKLEGLPSNAFWVPHLMTSYPAKPDCLRNDVKEWCDHSFEKWDHSWVEATLTCPSHIERETFNMMCSVITLRDHEDATLFKLKWM
jgi:hypothetical protein